MAKPRLRVVEDECCPRPRSRPTNARSDVRSWAPLLRALADETRLEIVGLLAASAEPLCACHIEAHFDLAQPTISHHLKVLRKVGLLASERRGTWIYYALDRNAIAAIARLPAALEETRR